MVSKPKMAGTKFESAIVASARERGLDAARHAEGGIHDHGDLFIRFGQDVADVECKVTQQGSPHRWLALQVTKSREGAMPIVAWKRMGALAEGGVRRTSQGTLAILRWDDLLDLLEGLDS